MKSRLIKDGREFQILCQDGSILNATNEALFSFLTDFKRADSFYGEDGTWLSDSYSEMSMYPGKTYAVVNDDMNLLIYDFSPFSKLEINTTPDETAKKFITPAEFGARHNRGAEIIKVYCREGRIPGAKRVGSTWVIPSNAPYPVAERHRRDDISLLRKATKKQK